MIFTGHILWPFFSISYFSHPKNIMGKRMTVIINSSTLVSIELTWQLIPGGGGCALHPKLGSMCSGQKKGTGPLLVQTWRKISRADLGMLVVYPPIPPLGIDQAFFADLNLGI